MAPPALTATVLIVSTTASNGESTDTTGPRLKTILESNGWAVDDVCIVPDSTRQISQQIKAWANEGKNLILTSGGTGFATTDVTPEAVAPLLDKQAPGLVQGMIAASLNITPFAIMSRPVAGVRGQSIIMTLPGSPKGAVENLDAVIKILPHGCLQAAGANSRALHAGGGVKKLEAEAGVSSSSSSSSSSSPSSHSSQKHQQHQHHGCGGTHAHLVRHTLTDTDTLRSNDPALGPSRRHRESPYPMISVTDALALIDSHLPIPEIIESSVDSGLVGMILAEDVVARENVPAFRASIVDGYAIVVPSSGAAKGIYPVVAVSHAAAADAAATLKEGQAARITTGAPLPPGANCVVMVEDTILKTQSADGAEEEEVELLAETVTKGDNIREIGTDAAQGTKILSKGERISTTGGEIGLLASVGVATVKTYRRPVVGVLSTGNELMDLGGAVGGLRHGQVRDSNRPSLVSVVRSWGYTVLDLGIAVDERGALEETLRSALRQADMVITTGGVSMGELDLLKPTIERALGGTIHFGRVAMKPGKPTTFATVPVKANDGTRVSKPIMSLPGNPASAIVTTHLFVLPALERLSGVRGGVGLPRVPVKLTERVDLDPRPEYHRAAVCVGRDGVLEAHSTGGQRSSRVASLKAANALLCLPGGTGCMGKGETIDALLMGPLQSAYA